MSEPPGPTESLLSPIRTLTVGSGITPDLLTFKVASEALAGFQRTLIYRRWGISPRPENKRDNYNAIDYLRQRITCKQIWFIVAAYHTTIIVRIYPNREHKMIDPKKIEQIARQVHESMPKGIREFGEDVEKKIRQTLQSQLTRLDLVSREEFDVQTQVLLRTREKLALLEQRLSELENRQATAEVKPAPAIPPVDAPDANA